MRSEKEGICGFGQEQQLKTGGFTLIELLVAVAIGTAIIGVMSMSIISMMKITPLNADRAVVLQQTQNAGYWITRDVNGATNVVPEPEAGILVRVEQREGYPPVTRQVDYVFSDTSLLRQVDGAPGTLIAQYIVADETSFEVSGNSTYRLNIKAAKGDVEFAKVYVMYQRYASE